MTDTLLVLPGPPAFSAFRLNKFLAQARAACPAVAALYAEFVHLLSVGGDLTTLERGVAEALLEYGPRVGLPQRVGEPRFTVLPRPGTISPWSSKATDILICGLTKCVASGAVRWYAAGARSMHWRRCCDQMTQRGGRRRLLRVVCHAYAAATAHHRTR
jgi:hypothetical protein